MRKRRTAARAKLAEWLQLVQHPRQWEGLDTRRQVVGAGARVDNWQGCFWRANLSALPAPGPEWRAVKHGLRHRDDRPGDLRDAGLGRRRAVRLLGACAPRGARRSGGRAAVRVRTTWVVLRYIRASAQVEDHGHGRDHRDGLAAEQRRRILP